MKKALSFSIVMLLVSGAAFAQPPTGYIGLYADETRFSCEVINPGGFTPFVFWIYVLPSYLGMICAEFEICYPPNVIWSTVTYQDPPVTLAGDLMEGLSICFLDCTYDWYWIAHQSCYLTDTTPSFIEVCPHPYVGAYQFANCEPGFPVEPCVVLNHLALNQPCVVATKDVSWGAIKNMMSE
jgi:hypothetical protein